MYVRPLTSSEQDARTKRKQVAARAICCAGGVGWNDADHEGAGAVDTAGGKGPGIGVVLEEGERGQLRSDAGGACAIARGSAGAAVEGGHERDPIGKEIRRVPQLARCVLASS